MASRCTPVDISRILSLGDVAQALQRLDAQLPILQLGQFALFNRSYQVVTELIRQGIKDDYFDNPKFIEDFIVCFAKYYFQAINQTVHEPGLTPPAWSKLNQYATDKSAPVFISLMLGANAHINNDLPHVLEKTMRGHKATHMLSDVRKIDKLLMQSGKRIIGLFEEKDQFLNFLKNRFQFLYFRPAMYTILYWRINAWKNYEKLKSDSLVADEISRRSTTIADRLIHVSKVLGH